VLLVKLLERQYLVFH